MKRGAKEGTCPACRKRVMCSRWGVIRRHNDPSTKKKCSNSSYHMTYLEHEVWMTQEISGGSGGEEAG
jgi:hypothetical protein